VTPIPSPITTALSLLVDAGARAAIIGGHAVNAWVEPRVTNDVDVLIHADPATVERVRAVLVSASFRLTREHGGQQPSGPDFLRFVGPDGSVLELQAAKTEFQRAVIARSSGNPPVASAEDLLILKLIANRTKDQQDIRNLLTVPALDWRYLEQRALEWGVDTLLAELRKR